eukprot:5764709-Pyramimonas_sp.AAC.1
MWGTRGSVVEPFWGPLGASWCFFRGVLAASGWEKGTTSQFGFPLLGPSWGRPLALLGPLGPTRSALPVFGSPPGP